MDIASALRELARNLYWTWHPHTVAMFRDLDAALWREVNHNPVEFLSRFTPEELEKRAAELGLQARINYATHRLEDYLTSTRTWGAYHAGPLHARPVACFSAEFGIHESLPIYGGGLGVLAGDQLKSASDLGVPMVGVGLFYAKGYFTQEVEPDGRQRERYFEADVEQLPLDRALGPGGGPLRVRVETRTSDIHLGVWTASVGRSRLVLLDSEVEENSEQDRALTAVLYGGDRRIRIRQELALGVGGMRALRALGVEPGVVHLNEGHSAFATLELARMLMERDARPFDQVQERAAGMTVFTTHTPVEAGHDRFDADLVEETLGPLRERVGLSPQGLMALGRVQPQDEREPLCTTVLGIRMSRAVNAVSSVHAGVTRAMWRGLWPDLPVHRIPIGHITNGVHVATWLSMDMARLYGRHLREGWQRRLGSPETWRPVGQIKDEEFWEQHQIMKVHLCGYVERCVRRQRERRGEPVGPEEPACARLDPAALTIGFARRFATYKRAGLLLRDLDRLDRLVNNPRMPVRLIISGKAHPADTPAKDLLQRVFQVTRDPRFVGRIVFIEDFDINVARHLVQGVDLWLNTPLRPHEACGTSGQKALLNGGLNLSILDGWWAEAYDSANGFAIGSGGEDSDPERQDAKDFDALFEALEQEVVPLYYERDEDNVPRSWVAMQKRAIQTLAWRYNADRMVMDYTLRCYLPAVGGCAAVCGPGPLGRPCDL